MSTGIGLARFNTRRAAQNDEHSEQIDFRAVGAREHGQLTLDEIEIESGAAGAEPPARSDTTVPTEQSPRADLEAALGCARATIDALREQVTQLEAERDRPLQETATGTETDQ